MNRHALEIWIGEKFGLKFWFSKDPTLDLKVMMGHG